MRERYLEVYEGGQGEIEEKKSRFIATVRPVRTEEEASSFIEEMRKKYWDARHNCTAFTLGTRGEIARCSDDGEPGGTAGRPMLDVIAGQEVRNVCVVVTRYFGGTLLGTGGLVRAYSQAVQEGLKNSLIIEKIPGQEVMIACNYDWIGKIQYLAAQADAKELETLYTANVEARYILPEEEVAAFENKIIEATGAQVKIERLGTPYFSVIGKELKLFDE